MSRSDPIANEIQLVADIVEKDRRSILPDSTFENYFNYFAADLVLKNYGLTADQILDGITDARADGQIDALYVLVNNVPVFTSEDLPKIKSDVVIELLVVQAKSNGSFSSNSMATMARTVLKIANLSEQIPNGLNLKLKKIAQVYRDARKNYVDCFAEIRFRIAYCANGIKRETDSLFDEEVRLLSASLERLEQTALTNILVLDAVGLYELARTRAKTTRTLKIEQIAIEQSGPSFVVLATIENYLQFISNEEGGLQNELFEENVRDFLGDKGVNEKIATGLTSIVEEEFWWLNNGITIVANRARKSVTDLSMDDPQIVNGLQTSHILWKCRDHISRLATGNRKVLVKVLELNSDDIRDRVIQATNSQSALPPSSLVVGEQVHKDIERFLLGVNYYYERRKNYYKNLKRPVNRIVTIDKLCQCVIAVLLGEPDMARARPGDFITKNRYNEVFPTSRPTKHYFIALQVVEYCRELLQKYFYDRKAEVNNHLFHVAYAAFEIAGGLAVLEDMTAEEIDNIILGRFTDANDIVTEAFVKVGEDIGSTGDQSAKSKEMRREVKARISSYLGRAENLGGLFE